MSSYPAPSRREQQQQREKEKVKESTGFKEKLAKMLGLQKPNNSGTGGERSMLMRPSSSSCAFLNSDVLRSLSNRTDAAARLKVLHGLEPVVAHNQLERGAVEILWLCVNSLMEEEATSECHRQCVQFLTVLCRAQYRQLGMCRTALFNFLSEPDAVLCDVSHLMELLSALTRAGVDVADLEDRLGDLLLVFAKRLLCRETCPTRFLLLLQNVLKCNAAYVDEDHLRCLIEYVCIATCHSSNSDCAVAGIELLDVVLCYSSWPPGTLLIVLTTMCKLVNNEELCHPCWNFMHNLLGSYWGHSAVYVMSSLLETSSSYPDHYVLRGAVSFIGMSLWGAKRVANLCHSPAAVLPSLKLALQSESMLVTYEVALQMQRLVSKYGRELQLISWNPIIAILKEIYRLMHKANVATEESTVYLVWQDIMNSIEVLYDSNMFNGPTDKFFDLVQVAAKERPEKSVMRLLKYLSQSLTSLTADWQSQLAHIIETYYRNESRTAVRLHVVAMIQRFVNDNCKTHGSQLCELVNSTVLVDVEKERDLEVQGAVINLMIPMSTGDVPSMFLEVIPKVEMVINSFVDDSQNDAFVSDSKWEQFVNDELALCGLINVLKHRWNRTPPSDAIYVMQILLRHLQLLYHKGLTLTVASRSRLIVLRFILSIRAHRESYQMAYEELGQPVYSHYITCGDIVEHGSACASPNLTCAKFPVSETLHVLILALQKEQHWPAMKYVLIELPKLLKNRALLATHENELREMCNEVLCLVNDGGRLESFITNSPENVTDSELEELVFPVLSDFLSYKSSMPERLAKKMAVTILAGIRSQKSLQAVIATTGCLLQAPSVVSCMMKSLVQQLYELPSSPKAAISVLELLTTLMQTPELVEGFGIRQYERVFALVASYVNPFLYTDFIVARSYQILFRWFVRIPVMWRPQVAKIVLQKITEISKRCDENDTHSQASSLSDLEALHLETRHVCLAFLALYTFVESPCMHHSATATTADHGGLFRAGKTGHWFIGNRIVSITTLMLDVDPVSLMSSTESLCENEETTETTVSSTRCSAPTLHSSESFASTTTSDNTVVRKRYHSAVQPKVTRAPEMQVQFSLDDSYLTNGGSKNAAAEDLSKSSAASATSNGGLTVSSNTFRRKESQGDDIKTPAAYGPCCSKVYFEVTVRNAVCKTSWLLLSTASAREHGAFANALSQRSQPATLSSFADAMFEAETLRGDHLMMDDGQKLATASSVTTAAAGSSKAQLQPRQPSLDRSLSAKLHEERSSSEAMSFHRFLSSQSFSSSDCSISMMDPSSCEWLVQLSSLSGATLSEPDPNVALFHLYGEDVLQNLHNSGAGSTAKIFHIGAESETFLRALKNIDLIPAFETQKVGVLYVGPRQTTEAEIFSNQSGSDRYQRFLNGLGQLVTLTDADNSLAYLGGLSTDGSDGKFAYVWLGEPLLRLVYHVATLMPSRSNDPTFQQKKKHIGNDFVTIVFNDSGCLSYELSTISGQFSYAAIIVEPCDDSTLHVRLKAKNEVAVWLALKEMVLRDEYAPAMCRQMALRADLSVRIWHAKKSGERCFVSNYVERWRKIMDMKSKFCNKSLCAEVLFK